MMKYFTRMLLATTLIVPTVIFADSGLAKCMEQYRHSKNRDSYCYGQLGKQAAQRSKQRLNSAYEQKKAQFKQDLKRQEQERDKQLQILDAAAATNTQAPQATRPTASKPQPQPRSRPTRRQTQPEESTQSIPYY